MTDVAMQVASLNQQLDLPLQGDVVLSVMLVISMKLIAFCEILPSFLVHLFQSLDNILAFDLY